MTSGKKVGCSRLPVEVSTEQADDFMMTNGIADSENDHRDGQKKLRLSLKKWRSKSWTLASDSPPITAQRIYLVRHCGHQKYFHGR